MPHPTEVFPHLCGRRTPRSARAPRSARRSIRPLLFVLALTSAACSDVTGVEEIRTEMLPSPMYEALWDRVEACSGRTGDFRRLRWYWVRSFPDGAAAKAQWNGRHEITLALAAVDNQAVVAHELLHELLEGDPIHADPAWDVCNIPRGDG